MVAIYGCYVNEQKEIVSDFKRGTGTMPQNEADKYFALFRRVLSGAQGKTLLDITFRTTQVADSPEHKLLMGLRGDSLANEENRMALYKQVIESLTLDTSYLILLGTESYDVPFKSKDDVEQADNSAEAYTYVLCAICPVKQTKAVLHYEPASRDFQDGNMVAAASAPVMGFLFPAFDNRAANIYNALYYNHNEMDNYEAFVSAVFNTPVAKPTHEQRATFRELLADTLETDCNMEIVQAVHDEIRQRITLHKESKVPDALTISQAQITTVLESCGVSAEKLEKFTSNFEAAFGIGAELYPDNILDSKKIEVKTPSVTVKVAADRSDLIETRIIGGVKYILIQADDDVEVNGIPIQFDTNNT